MLLNICSYIRCILLVSVLLCVFGDRVLKKHTLEIRVIGTQAYNYQKPIKQHEHTIRHKNTPRAGPESKCSCFLMYAHT